MMKSNPSGASKNLTVSKINDDVPYFLGEHKEQAIHLGAELYYPDHSSIVQKLQTSTTSSRRTR